LGLIVLSPLLLAVAALVSGSSPGGALFRQRRVGRNFRPFNILKFRTMVLDAPSGGPQITTSADPRVTRVGRVLRNLKIDELPQLINVVRGDMSLVGPRPEVPKYVDMFRDDYAVILSVRPGITDLASLKYRHESEILGRAKDPEMEYLRVVLPDKIALAKQYIEQSSLRFDLLLIAKTLIRISFGPEGQAGSSRRA
jgi:lipopolysaccharide/colanic/teichoic acid biosynthesis glycosyltransferase